MLISSTKSYPEVNVKAGLINVPLSISPSPAASIKTWKVTICDSGLTINSSIDISRSISTLNPSTLVLFSRPSGKETSVRPAGT